MNEKIKQQAQELYPPEEKASEYVALLRGARMVVEQLMKLPIDKALLRIVELNEELSNERNKI